jgi:hypothetical protein
MVMEPTVTMMLWVLGGVLGAVVYLNLGWLLSAMVNEEIRTPRWLDEFFEGPEEWRGSSSDSSGEIAPKIIIILIGVPFFLIFSIWSLCVWGAFFTFGGGIVRRILLKKVS